MRIVGVLVVLSVAQQATAAEPPSIGDGQPAWLIAYENFQRAGDLIVAGEYESARQLLLESASTLPNPYKGRAQAAAGKLPLTGRGDDNFGPYRSSHGATR
jgi:hypothetical protein